MYFSFGESMEPLLFIYHEFQSALSGVRGFWLHQEIWHKRDDLFFRAIQETVGVLWEALSFSSRSSSLENIVVSSSRLVSFRFCARISAGICPPSQ